MVEPMNAGLKQYREHSHKILTDHVLFILHSIVHCESGANFEVNDQQRAVNAV